MVRRPVITFILAMVCLWRLPVYAQDAPGVDPPAHISNVEGAAFLERDGRTDADPLSMPLLAGDRVRTQDGRVEVLFTDGSSLHLDAHTVVDFQSDEVVRLLEGRVRLTVARGGDIAYRIDAPSAWVQIDNPGEYRLAILRGGDVELAVLRGGAELVNEAGRTFVRAGERTFARTATAPSPAYVFNSAAWDPFDQWSESRRDRRLGVSAQYLPEDVRRYAPAFDAHGSWRYEQVHGYVWYPRTQVGWRPYHRGRWVSLRPYGWTWIAGDPWGWPTHHYGRWGVSAGSWFWIPGRTWAPAWVSWAYAPGYVSWCPLGWNNRPVLQFVNVNGYGRRHDPWDAWTVLPRHHFGGAYVNVSRAASVRIDPRLHHSFVIDGRAPAVHHAIGRSASPIRTAGRYSANRRDGQGVGGLRSTADGVARDRDAGVTDGRFPAAARAPGTAIAPPSRGRDRATAGDQAISPAGRTTTRETRPGESASYAPADETSRTGSREAPRGAVAVPRRAGAESGGPMTVAPDGAVRAMPRRRSEDGMGAVANGPDDARGRRRSPDSAPPAPSGSPAYSSPRSPSPQPEPSTPGYPAARYSPESSTPRYRTTPSDRAMPRGEEAPGYSAPARRAIPDQPARSRERSPGPAYRPAPERQAPAGPPPTAAPSPQPGGEERQGGGRARQSGGEGRTTGGAVRRQR